MPVAVQRLPAMARLVPNVRWPAIPVKAVGAFSRSRNIG